MTNHVAAGCFFCDAWNASGGAQAMVQLLACFPRSCFERFGY